MCACYVPDRQVYVGIVGIQGRHDQFSQGMEIGQWIRESEKVWKKQGVISRKSEKKRKE